jgi:hypothetical protein
MNPIANAIFAALDNSDKVDVAVPYNALKNLLERNFGSESDIMEAVEFLEKKPASVTRRMLLDDELEENKNLLNSAIIEAAQAIHKYLNDENTTNRSTTFSNTQLKKLDFGRESAETDAEFIRKGFLYTSIFDRIKDGKKHLVLGRKGTGKTAACIKLYEYLENQGANVSLVTPRDLSKFKMLLLEKGSINSSESSLLSWKYILLKELCLDIVEDAKEVYGDNYLVWPDFVRRVRKFVADNESDKASWIDKTFKVIRSIR